MEELIKAIILGFVQGWTEWLPISSTGHLRIVQDFLGLEIPILFDVLLHIGTLVVISAFFRKEILKVLSAIRHLDFKTEHGRMVPSIIVGVIPTFLIGLVFGRLIEDTFRGIFPIAIALVFCGVILYSVKLGKEKSDRISYLAALAIGTAQGISIIPGISRSGVTIAVALLVGIRREKAFEFSFLLSIPAVLGALGLTLFFEYEELSSSSLGWNDVLIGMVVAMIVGYFALKILWRTVASGKFHLFAFYCWLLASVLIVLSSF